VRRPGYSLGRFLEPYRRPHIFAVLDRQDVGPAAARAVYTMRVATERARRKFGR
jgi:hypothetical protein